jgi:hypothetical protein
MEEKHISLSCMPAFLSYLYSPTEIFGTVVGHPEIKIKTYTMSTKMASKLAFMQREDIERVILRHLEFDGKKKEFSLNIDIAIDELRMIDLTQTKYKYSQLYSQMLVPEWMLHSNEEGKMEEEQEGEEAPKKQLVTIDITIK